MPGNERPSSPSIPTGTEYSDFVGLPTYGVGCVVTTTMRKHFMEFVESSFSMLYHH